MTYRALLTCLTAGALLLGGPEAFAAQEAADPAPGESLEWNARRAEHLLNRAGFGARPAEVEWAVRVGAEGAVDSLLTGFDPDFEPFYVDAPDRPRRLGMEEADYRKAVGVYRREQRDILFAYAGWWFDLMLEGRHPLRERMTLFWHGHFTSSYRDVRNGAAMARQNQLLREHALGNFGTLLRGMVHDPALLAYLDGDRNKKREPNENLARELMELFTLGEGNYTEQDVKEAARALTGWQLRLDGADSFFNRRQHDAGRKSILGREARHDARSLANLLLRQEACPRWIAGRLLAYFEGREPAPARLDEYAALLRRENYELSPFLRELFLDPRFYSDEVIGNRVAGPVDFLVGSARRLGIRPPPHVLWFAAGQLGQRLFDPPNVEGWKGGEDWITTSSFLQRGNLAGMLIGVVRLEDVLSAEDLVADAELGEGSMEMGMDPGMDPSMTTGDAGAAPARLKDRELGESLAGLRRAMDGMWRPGVHLSARLARLGAGTDAELVDTLGSELLPVDLSPESRASLLEFVRAERLALELGDGELLSRSTDSERVLRRLAHLLLSLPEAQLN